jgi:hypothetical protein
MDRAGMVKPLSLSIKVFVGINKATFHYNPESFIKKGYERIDVCSIVAGF